MVEPRRRDWGKGSSCSCPLAVAPAKGRGPILCWGGGRREGRESGKCKTGGETAGGLFLPEPRQGETKLSDVHDLHSRVGRANDVED